MPRSQSSAVSCDPALRSPTVAYCTGESADLGEPVLTCGNTCQRLSLFRTVNRCSGPLVYPSGPQTRPYSSCCWSRAARRRCAGVRPTRWLNRNGPEPVPHVPRHDVLLPGYFDASGRAGITARSQQVAARCGACPRCCLRGTRPGASGGGSTTMSVPRAVFPTS